MISYVLLCGLYIIGSILVELCSGGLVYLGLLLIVCDFILLCWKVSRMDSEVFGGQ